MRRLILTACAAALLATSAAPVPVLASNHLLLNNVQPPRPRPVNHGDGQSATAASSQALNARRASALREYRTRNVAIRDARLRNITRFVDGDMSSAAAARTYLAEKARLDRAAVASAATFTGDMNRLNSTRAAGSGFGGSGTTQRQRDDAARQQRDDDS